MSEISERLLKILSDNDISYGELSARTSIPKSALQRYATGQTDKIPISRLEIIAKAIGTTPGILMGWEEDTNGPQEVFAANLREYMVCKSKRQRDIAEAVGVSEPTVSDWLRAKKYPRIDKMEKLAQFLGISKSDLIEKKYPVPPKSLDKQNSIKEVSPMPVLSAFYGIIVRMYQEKGGKHNMPHIHAEFSGDEVVLSLDGTVLEGSIPKNKLKLLEAWIVIHHDDLEANWKLLSDGEQFFRIDPLK